MQRLIEIPGVFNFRDIGGYPTRSGHRTRWSRLYRSGALHRVQPDGISLLQSTLGVKTIIDLRWADDLKRAGTLGPLAEMDIERHHRPLGNAEILKDVPPLPVELAYVPLATRSGADVAAIARTLGSESTFPAVIHCSAGKDRTGIFTALLLALLGVEDDLIVEDYSLTASEMPRWIAYRIAIGELPPESADTPHPGDAIAPDAIRSMLATLRNDHGSIEGYLLNHGLSPKDISTLRDHLLE